MLKEKAINYFILARIAESSNMLSESASNYFKSLTAINDLFLNTLGLKAKDHSERFYLLKVNNPELYKITDELFNIYRKTYLSNLEVSEIQNLKLKIEEAFKNVGINIPTKEEIKKRIKNLSK